MDLLFYLIVGAVIGAVCFTIGWKVAIHPDIVSNERALERQKELNLEINTQEARVEILKNEKEKLQQQYNETQQFISDAEKNAETIYATKCAQLEDKYKQKEKELQAIQEEKKESFAADIKKIEDDLESLKATKLAAIDAARKEKEITENKEAYCLILPKEEERDIPILREAQYKVSKPRAVAMCIWSNYYLPIAKEKLPKILGKNDIVGIYKLTNQKTGECYIGQSRDIKKRIYEHMRAGLGVDTPSGNQLYIAMQEYGLDNFSIELLEECNPEELNKKEKYFIELYQSNIVGYNISGGNK